MTNRTILLLTFATTVFLLFAGIGSASAASDPRVPALQRQVRTLTAQVKALTARLAKEEQLSRDRDTCLFALDRDSTRTLYHTVAGVVSYITGNPPAPDLPRFDDQGACARAGIIRSP